MPNSQNFEFLIDYDPIFIQLASAAEYSGPYIPDSSLSSTSPIHPRQGFPRRTHRRIARAEP